MSSLITFLTPWEFSPVVLVACVLAGTVYARGARALAREGRPLGGWRTASFWIGLAIVYLYLQSYLDYLSQHMFWVHRLQHLVLHHLGPVLMVLGAPPEAIVRGLGPRARALGRATPAPIAAAFGGAYRAVQHPLVAPVLFVGLIYFWLTPSIHFDAMLSLDRYQAMNWSMTVDGLLFWWLVLDPRPPRAVGAPSYGTRVVMLFAVMPPQIVLGAYIALHDGVLYDVYGVCGRAWTISPIVDQQIGGLITWIPSSMMSVVGGLVVLRMWLAQSERQRAARLAAAVGA